MARVTCNEVLEESVVAASLDPSQMPEPGEPATQRTLEKLYLSQKDRPAVEELPKCLLSFDPGGTTGVAEFQQLHFINAWQVNTSCIEWGVDRYHHIIHARANQFGRENVKVVAEEYRIYAWRTKEHIGSDILTLRLIGVLECLCRQYRVLIHKQSAHIGKAFVTDQKLHEWNMYISGQPHARDAIRHAAQFLLFGKEIQ